MSGVLERGAIVHVGAIGHFGRVVSHHIDPTNGEVYLLDFMGFGQYLVLQMAVWPGPVLAGRPVCQLSTDMGNA